MTLSRRQWLKTSAAVAAGLLAPGWPIRAFEADNIGGQRLIGDGATGPDIHRGATPGPVPPGPFAPTWDSLRQNYNVPRWFADAKFGIFIHWGLYAVPAYHNEWYARHMYGAFVQWHTDHFGPPDKFGYKDFISLFKAE